MSFMCLGLFVSCNIIAKAMDRIFTWELWTGGPAVLGGARPAGLVCG